MRKEKSKEKERVDDDGSYVVKTNHKTNIFIFIGCLLIAFVIWIYVMNVERKNFAISGTTSADVTQADTECSDAA